MLPQEVRKGTSRVVLMENWQYTVVCPKPYRQLILFLNLIYFSLKRLSEENRKVEKDLDIGKLLTLFEIKHELFK